MVREVYSTFRVASSADAGELNRLTELEDTRLIVNKHLKTHAPRDVACTGCDRRFDSASSVVLHQEEATCVSGMDLRFVNQLARVCGKSTFVPGPVNDNGPIYKCECNVRFRYMSGLMQHVESPACPSDLGFADMEKFLSIVVEGSR